MGSHGVPWGVPWGLKEELLEQRYPPMGSHGVRWGLKQRYPGRLIKHDAENLHDVRTVRAGSERAPLSGQQSRRSVCMRGAVGIVATLCESVRIASASLRIIRIVASRSPSAKLIRLAARRRPATTGKWHAIRKSSSAWRRGADLTPF